MVGAAATVAAGGTRGLVMAGAVDPCGRVAAALVGIAEVPRARGCGAGATAKVARLTGAGDCRAAGATEVARWDGAGGWAESPERKEAWRRSAVARAAAVERSCASMMATRASHSWSSVWAVVRLRCKMESWERRGAATRSCSAVPRSIVWRSESVIAAASADTQARANPSSTSWRETFTTLACCLGVRVSQMDAKCPRWGGGPVMAMKVRGSGAVGRKPGVRPVLAPVEARRSAGAIGERSRSGPGAEGGGEAILVVSWAEVPVGAVGEAVVDEGLEVMLWEARRAARGVKPRGGATRTVKGGWSAIRVVAQGAGAEVL